MSGYNYRFEQQVEAIQELLTNRLWKHPRECLTAVWMPLMRGIDAFVEGKIDFSGVERFNQTFREALASAPWDHEFRHSFLGLLKVSIIDQLILWKRESNDLKAMNAAHEDGQRALKRLMALHSFNRAISTAIVLISS